MISTLRTPSRLLAPSTRVSAAAAAVAGWAGVLVCGGLALASDNPLEAVTGAGSGWASFGLAGVIVWWLLRVHMPEKDRQLAEVHKAHAEDIKQLLADHRAELERRESVAAAMLVAQRDDFGKLLAMQQETCAKELAALSSALGTAVIAKVSDELGPLIGAVQTLITYLQRSPGFGAALNPTKGERS